MIEKIKPTVVFILQMGEILEEVITSITIKSEHTNDVYFSTVNDRHFLGDLGVPGYAYDDRPCLLHFTREEAEAALPAYNKWFNRGNKRVS